MQDQLLTGFPSLAKAIPMSVNPFSMLLTGPGYGVNALLDALPDQFYIKDTQYRFVFVNTATARFLNYPATELIGKTDHDLFPRSLADQFLAEEKELLTTGQPLVNREACIADPGSPLRWELTTKIALRDDHGQIVGLLGINRDITATKIAHEQLQQLNADLARSQLELLETYENLKRAQAHLVQSEKLEMVGRLAAGIAHEVRNPLAILAMGLGYIESSLPPNQPAADTVLGTMRDAIVRADAIISELLDFSSPRVLDLTGQDVSKLADRSLLLVKHELSRRRIMVVRDYTPGLPVQQLDRIRIEQVFVNLFMNAIHAMPDGGQLTVRIFRKATGSVVAEISDTGPGIPAGLVGKVFEPFFTTKPAGSGTGLGLAVAKSILNQHGGELKVANRPDGGVSACLIFQNKTEANHGT